MKDLRVASVKGLLFTKCLSESFWTPVFACVQDERLYLFSKKVKKYLFIFIPL